MGFLSVLGADWADSRGLPAWRRLGIILSFSLVAPSFAYLLVFGPFFPVPIALRLLAAGIALASALLLYCSLYLEIRPKSGEGPRRTLVTSGSYGLARHPGPLWLFAFHAALGLASGSTGLLAALPVWTLMNVILVFVEDRALFPRIFGDAYEKYKEEVPFLLPSRSSLRRFLAESRPTNARSCLALIRDQLQLAAHRKRRSP